MLAEAEAQLRAQGIATPRLDAEALLAHTLATDRAHLFTRLSSLLTHAEQEAFQRRLERRARREPLAYITGKREFWSLDFRVTPDVLIPRPETEVVVETVLKLTTQKWVPSPLVGEGPIASGTKFDRRFAVAIPSLCLSPTMGREATQPKGSRANVMEWQSNPLSPGGRGLGRGGRKLLSPDPHNERRTLSSFPPSRERRAEDFASHLTILDVGAGSGCIAISLARELPSAELWAIDISQTALAIALENARRHKVEKRIRFLQGDLFSALNEDGQSFDLIVSNPPYITHPDLAVLQPEVREWEPREALDGGRDGLDFYRRLVKESPAYLRPGGWLVMELGAGQRPAVTRLIQAQSNFQESFSVQDYAGLERVVATRSCV